MKNNKQFTLLVLFTGLLVVLLLGCPTEAPKEKDKGGDDPIDVSAIMQSSLWEDDAEKDCDTINTNSGNTNKGMYIFDTDGKYYSTNFAGLENTGACSNTSGWPLTVSREDAITVGKAAGVGFTNTYSVSGNTISLTAKSNLQTINSTMAFSTNNGGTLTHENGKVFTKLDAGSD